MSLQHPSALFWSQWAANDLPLLRKLEGAWHLRRCASCQSAAQRMRASQAAYEQSEAFAAGLAKLQQRTPAARPWHIKVWPTVALTGSLAAASFMLQAAREPPVTLHAKGAPTHFAMYLQRGNTVVPLPALCRAGDALRARYQSPRAFLLVVEIDGRNAAQVVFPTDASVSAPIDNERNLTPGSWVLDDSPHRERFVALFTDAPTSLSQSRACIDDAAACDTRTIRLEVACSKGD